MLFTKDNFQDLDDDLYSDPIHVQNYKDVLEDIIATAKNILAAYEAEIVNCNEKLKTLASSTVETVQTKVEETVEVVQDKAEEIVETVKEEVKKAAPKKPVRKAAAKKEEKAPEKDADSDK